MKKKIYFLIVIIVFPVILLTFTELLLRITGYGEPYKLFIEKDLYGKPIKICNPEYGKKYFYKLNYTKPANDIFLKNKPENCYRIFVLGSSTVVGFPYSYGVMFPRILNQRLRDSYPDKHVEVINTAITAINSYTFLDRIDEILKEKPDAILIYAGHNEFYGALGIASKEGLGKNRGLKLLHLKLLNFRVYQALREIIFKSAGLFEKNNPQELEVSATLMERIVSNKNIGYNSGIYNKAIEQYRKNMAVVLKKARDNNVKVFISEVISNVKDLPPFASLKYENFPSADSIYNLAKELEKNENYTKASKMYFEAKDLDCIRFRASEDINDVIKELAQKYDAILVPMKTCFSNASPDGLIGDNLLTEHVHPNFDGYFIMADAFYNLLVKSEEMGRVDPGLHKTSEFYKSDWGFTSLDSLNAKIKIDHLKAGWPFNQYVLENNYLSEYKPKSFIDTLAYQTVRYADVSLETAHLKLAKYYLVQEMPLKAYEEYKALIEINPNYIRYYLEAGNLLFEHKFYDQALDVYKNSLVINEEIFAIYRIGEIYSILGRHENAILFLNKLRNIDPDFSKQKVLTLLLEAYNKINKTEEANKIKTELKKISKTSNTKNEVILYTPAKVKEDINQAFSYLKKGNTTEALAILKKANKKQETALANRIIGEILFQKKDAESLYYLKRAYSEYNNDGEFLNTLCYACIKFNDLDFANKILPELKQLSPNNPNINKFEQMIKQKEGK